MTEDQNGNNKSKLGLASSTLKLGKDFENNQVKQNFVQTRSNSFVVEVKKKRFSAKDLLFKENSPSSIDHLTPDNLTNDEFQSRLAAIKHTGNSSLLKKDNVKHFVELVDIEKPDINNQTINKAEKSSDDPLVNKEGANIDKIVVNPTNDVNLPTKHDHGPKNTFLEEAKKKNNNIALDNDLEKNKKNIKPENRLKVAPKVKYDESKKIVEKINSTSGTDEEDFEITRPRSFSSLKRQRDKARRDSKHLVKPLEKVYREIILPEFITLQELSNRMSERVADVTKELMKLGMLVTSKQAIDADTAEILIETFGHKAKRVTEADVENKLLFTENDVNLQDRPPVVTIMGHVDHGKTSLLDALRMSDVALGEAGGITQHIGAYQITMPNGKHITFIDTPGHEAFTAMRSRGAKATDIVVLVVAADDGIMEQTIEAINHAKAANVPIIVAINKIDKESADPTRVKHELLQHGLVTDDLGGDVLVVEVSAKEKINLDKLEETIILQAEMLALKANYNCKSSGMVIESKIDKNRGVITTVLVQRGTLKVGDIVVAGDSMGKIRNLIDDKGRFLKEATPTMPVEILGFDQVADAGETFNAVDHEKQAREIADYRKQKKFDQKNILNKRGSLQELFAKSGVNKVKELPIIIKGDAQGSVEAIISSLNKLEHPEVKVRILHKGTGGISESDIALAKASSALILGFNVRASAQVKQNADSENIDIRYYSIIYNLIDDVKVMLSGMLDPIIREEYIGLAEIRQVFNITKAGKIAGSYVQKGYIARGAGVRLLRDNIVIHEGKLKTLKRFKEDVKEVRENYECGIAFENYDDIREGDKVEVFKLVEEIRSI